MNVLGNHKTRKRKEGNQNSYGYTSSGVNLNNNNYITQKLYISTLIYITGTTILVPKH